MTGVQTCALPIYHRLNHLLDFIQWAIARLVRAALRITDRTVEVAVIVDFNQRQAGVLFMISAEAAIIRAAPLHRRIKDIRHLRRFDKNLAAAAVVINIIGQQNFFTAVPGTPLQHEYLAVLKDDLSLHLFQTG